MVYDLRIAVLAGINKGEYAKQEAEQKEYFSKVNKVKQLSTAEKMALPLDNGESVLENTIKTLLEITHDVGVIGVPSYLEKNTTSQYEIIPQTGKSQLESIEQAITHIYKNGFQGDGLVVCGDIPAIKKEDIESFVYKASEKNKDIVMGLSDMAEIVKLGSPNKRGVRARDTEFEFNSINPKLVYGNIFLISPNVYERLDDVKKAISPLLNMKKLFRDPKAYPTILEYLNETNEPVTARPKTKAGLVISGLSKSSMLTRLFFRNYLGFALSKNAVTIQELNSFVENKVFHNVLTFALGYATPRLGMDVDDEKDVEAVNSLLHQ